MREECEENIFTSARGIVDRVMNVEFEGNKYNFKSILNKKHDIDIGITIYLSYNFLKKLSYEVVYLITLFHKLFNVVAVMLSVYIINYINTPYK